MQKELIIMIWKAMIIPICIISSIGFAFGLINLGHINDGDSQIYQSPKDEEVSDGNSVNNLNNISDMNIINNRGANGYINQNIGSNGLVALNQSTPSSIMPSFWSESTISENTGNKQIADSSVQYTIYFYNINYEFLPGKDQEETGKTNIIQQYPPSFKETLKQHAKNAKILEKEREENIRLLKEISS
jgi:hypothetical protein